MRLAKAGTISLLAVVAMLVSAAVAFGYPSSVPGASTDPSRTECIDCHGRESGEATGTIATPSTHKGPHGAYTAGTTKCKTCHSVHSAPEGSTALLPAPSVKDTCESCHDGTGGTGVYGVIKARTGIEPAAAHSINSTSSIPGGNPDGSSAVGRFSGPGGTLTCSDCHSPHDGVTVEPFVGDRVRSDGATETPSLITTNRLLRQQPVSADATVAVYGAGWCASCHRGRGAQHAPDATGMVQDHPIMSVEGTAADEYSYDNLPVVAGVDSTDTVLGRLGGNNAGYVIPEGEGGPGSRSALQEGRGPICQQCHEDARTVGPSDRGTNPVLSEEQTFTVGAYLPDGSDESTGNPQFTVFPHESDSRAFLVTPYEPEPAEPADEPSYSLCLNCHSLLHEVPEEYSACVSCHDEGDAVDLHAEAQGCETCHLPDTVPTMACDSCHGANLHPDTDHSVVLSSKVLMSFFTEQHKGQNRPAWEVEDVDCGMGCHSNDLVAAHDNKCATCHPGDWSGFDPAAGCEQPGCHTTYHEGALEKHNPYASGELANEYCNDCHERPGTELQPEFCMSCHTSVLGSGAMGRAASSDTTIPLTISDAQATYLGPAYIQFSLIIDGEPADGTTYRRLDGGRVMAGPAVMVFGAGEHTLEYWSVSADGATEAPSNVVTFTIEEDITAPQTYSDIQTSYAGAATITLSPTDDGSAGVRYTYYKLDGGPAEIWEGIEITVPAPESTPEVHTLEFWSVDWSGNIELLSNVGFITMPDGT